MESLYDVFSAIRDDEGDHVGTMEACLDPTIAKLSPSLERRFLTGIAIAAVATVFLSGLDTGADVDTLADGASFAADDAAGATVLDAAIAGLAGIASQLGRDPEEGAGIANLLEGGALAGIRKFLAEAAVFFARFF